MTSFYIVPPRKTQLGDNGISISGTLGVITTNPGGAAITGVGALKLDTTYSPTWTGIHTFTQPIVFAGSQVINSTLISTSGQTAGDLFYYSGTSWSRLAVGSNNQVLQSFGGGIGWTGGVNLTNVITGNLKIGSLNGVLKASSGVVSGNSGIGDLSNVLLNLPASGNFLKYNGTNWVNSPIPLSDHNIIIRFLNGYTPVQTGIDIEVATVPYEPSDGTTILEYTITRIIFQAEIAGSTSSQVTIERALNGQEFDNPMTLGNTVVTLTLSSGAYEVFSTGPFFKIYSGERLRLNINSIGTGAQQWTVQVEGTAGNPYNGTNAGITSINSLAAQLQTMIVGTGGTDFNISSVIDTHTFNIPSASGTNRGLVTIGNQTFSGIKTFSNTTKSTSTTTGAVIVNGGVGIGESIYVGGNVVVGNELILNNPLNTASGGTGLSVIGDVNSFLAVNNAGSALEYKKLIAGTGITFNFSGSEIILESTGGTGGTGVISGGGISSLNGISYINYPEQTFAVGSSGTDFNIVSSGSTHTFNLPEAGSGSSGIVTTASQSFAGEKTFDNNIIALSDLNVTGATNLTSAVGVSSGVNISGGLGITGAAILRSTLQVSGITRILNNTNASSSTSGALIVTGGIGASGSLYVGNGANINSNNTSNTLASSGLVFNANSLTTGTGAYIASNSLTTGKLVDIAVSGNTATGNRIALNVTMQGVNASSGLITYGVFSNNTSAFASTNIGVGAFASGGTNNVPLRLGLNTSRYINFFINSEGNGLTLSPTATGTPFLALGGYSGVTAELRLLQSGGIGAPNHVAFKAPVTVTNTYDLIFPDTYPSSSNMTLVGTGTTQVTLSWSSLGSGGIGGTINPGNQNKLAFYVDPNGSSTLDDAQALTYATSGANLTINSTSASVVPLKLVGAVSQTADLFQVNTSSANIFNIDKNGISTFANDLIITSTTNTTSSSTGALTVTGGLGVQGKINVGAGISVAAGSNFASTVEIYSLQLLNSLSLSYGGTGLGTSGLPNQMLGMNSTSSALEYKTLNAGFGISVSHSSNSITLSVTSAGSGISSLNGLTSAEQTFAVGSSGTNFNIVSSGSSHTFNLPSAGSGSSGIITTSAQTISGNKSFNDTVVVSGLGVTNDATFRSTVDIYGGLGITGAVTLRSTLSVNGITTLLNNTNASSTSTGSLVVNGGVGVGGTIYTNNLYVLGSTILANALTIANGGTGTTNGSITGTGALTFTAGGTNTNINLVPNGTGTVDVSNKRITSLATPVNVYDAVTKVYVDQIAQGINYHDHVEAATTAGLGATYQNGVLGVGATLQASPAAGWSTSYSDGVILTVGDRILVKNQSGAGVTVQNGIYTVSQLSSPWILTRSSDYDNSIAGAVGPGDTVWVAFGNTLQYTTWTQTSFGTGNSSGGILIGTDPISYIQTAGAGSYSGDGSTISITGSVISIATGYAGQTSISTLGAISTGSWNASVINVQYGGTGSSNFTSNGVLYGNGTSPVQATSASLANGAILTTSTSGGSPSFSNTLQGEYVISNNTNSTSSTSGALSILGGLGISGNVFVGSNINILNTANISSGIGISGNTNITGGLGVTGTSIFRSSVIIQSGGLGVTGGIVISQGGLGVTGATVLNSNLTVAASTILNSTLNAVGNVSFASALNVGGPSNLSGLGVSGNIDITGGVGVSGKSIFRDSVIIQSGGLGVTGGIVISQGGLGVTGATTLRSTLTVLGTASFATINQGIWNGTTIGLSYGGTGLGSTGTSNQLLGMSNDSTGLEYKTLVAGSNVTISNSTNSITISATTGGGGGSGTVNTGLATQVAYYAVGGTSVSGTSNLTVGSSGVGISFATQSTSSTTGALVITGGIGVSGNVRIGSGLGVSGALNFASGTFGNTGSSTFTLNFLSSGNSPISLNVLSDNSLSFEGSSGQLLSISNNLSSGIIYSINNISGLPLFRANADGTVSMGEFSGNIGVGTSTPQFKLHVIGNTNITGGFGVSGLTSLSGGLGVTGHVNLSSSLVVQSNANITGGLGVTGATVLRSTVQSLGAVTINDNTNSASSTSGALIVTGGIGVSGNLNVGTGLTALGIIHAASNTNSTSSTSGSVIVTGGIGVSGRIWAGSGISSQGGGTFAGALSASSLTLANALSIANGGTGIGTSGNTNQILGMSSSTSGLEYKTLTAGSNLSISHTSGTITLNVVGAGISSINGLTSTTQTFATGYSGTDFNIVSSGSTHTFNIPVAGSGSSGIVTTQSQTIAGAKTFSSDLSIIASTVSTSSTSGALVVSGGVGISGNLNVGTGLTVLGVIHVASNTNSTSSTSGALIVTGGIGVSGRIFGGTGLSILGGATFNSTITVNNAAILNSTLYIGGSTIIQGGLGVTGGIAISQGGLGVTGATVLRSTLSVLGTASFATINQGIWNGSTIGLSYGGTGLGSTGSANQLLGMSNDSTSLEYKTLIAGSNISISNSTNSITISAAGGSGSGTVNSGLISQVAYYTVGGTSVSGTANMTIGSSGVGISFATQSISSTSGSLVVTGGIGVSGNLNVGTGLTVLGVIHVASNTNSTSSTSGALIVTGGIGVSGRIWAGSGLSSQGGGTFTGALSASSLTLATALPITSGGTGLGISGIANQILGMNSASSALEYKTLITGANLSITHGSATVTLNVVGAGISSLNGLTSATQTFTTGYSGSDFNIVSSGSTHTFNLPVAGVGASGIITNSAQTIAGAKTFTGNTLFTSNTNSTSSTTGALQISGGLGVSGNLYVGTGLSVAGSVTLRSGISSTGGAPIYITSGTNLTTPEPGAVEFDGSYLYFTPTSVRKQISNIALSGTAPSGANAGDFWWDATSGVLKIYYDSYWVETTGTDIYTAISEQVLSINDTTNSISSTSGALIVKGGIGVSGNLNVGSGLGISGLTTLTYTSERLNTKTLATGTITHDLTTGSIFYHSSISNNFTANITNVPSTDDRAIGVTLILSQGGTAYMVTALQIDGNAQTIKWINNSVPSGAANKVDVVGFSLIRTGSAWTVLGQYSTYG